MAQEQAARCNTGMLSLRRRAAAVLAGLVLAALAAFVWSLSAGALPVSFDDLLTALSGTEGGMEADIIRSLRLPRAVAAFACGGLLALAGLRARVQRGKHRVAHHHRGAGVHHRRGGARRRAGAPGRAPKLDGPRAPVVE